MSDHRTDSRLSTDDSEEARHYNEYQNTEPREHEAKFSHELIGGAAAFEAMKAYEDHEARNGTTILSLDNSNISNAYFLRRHD